MCDQPSLLEIALFIYAMAALVLVMGYFFCGYLDGKWSK